ncbi:hypothetical protein CYMTET_46025 [Cymbomonas tetramitiformis]|uniref:Uncharacterized protein n=1 Tax=Cymbomonas tetramitiformis TaxID=36881 RepID=A0AAE0EXQ1_9CHLO|nr:hypothetical protein CYMTET_46025 [Cymbomonas tetramitiformis]
MSGCPLLPSAKGESAVGKEARSAAPKIGFAEDDAAEVERGKSVARGAPAPTAWEAALARSDAPNVARSDVPKVAPGAEAPKAGAEEAPKASGEGAAEEAPKAGGEGAAEEAPKAGAEITSQKAIEPKVGAEETAPKAGVEETAPLKPGAEETAPKAGVAAAPFLGDEASNVPKGNIDDSGFKGSAL